MDWLFNHPQVFIIIAIVVASLVQKLKQANPPPPARGSPDAEAAERTRRVQAEIRRKIAERMGGAAEEAPPPFIPPVVEPSSAQRSPNIFKEIARQMAEAKRLAELRELQRADGAAQQRMEDGQKARELAEAHHLTDARQALEKNRRAAETAVAYGVVDPKQATQAARTKLRLDLRAPADLRRAIVLREILGPPVGLR